jgi:hypothetical protein
MTTADQQALHEALRSQKLASALDTAEASADCHSALAQANAVPPEQSFEWLAKQFQMLPYRPVRPSLSVQTEALFRSLAGPTDAPEPWLPVGPLGPLVILAHYNPAAVDTWGIPEAFCVKVLVSQDHYAEFRTLLDERLAARPLGNGLARQPSSALERGNSPEAALRWLLEEYPFRE